MEPAFAAGVFVGLVPALLLLYHAVRERRGPVHQRIFLLLAIGMVGGGFGFLLTIVVVPTLYAGLDLLILGYGLGFPLLEGLMKAVVLFYRRLQGDAATPFYGAAFGAGYAAVVSIAATYRGLYVPGVSPASYIPMSMLLSTALALLHIWAGVVVGFGSFVKRPARYIPLAVAGQIPFNLLLIAGDGAGDWKPAFIAAGAAWGAALYMWAASAILPWAREGYLGEVRGRLVEKRRRHRVTKAELRRRRREGA